MSESTQVSQNISNCALLWRPSSDAQGSEPCREGFSSPLPLPLSRRLGDPALEIRSPKRPLGSCVFLSTLSQSHARALVSSFAVAEATVFQQETNNVQTAPGRQQPLWPLFREQEPLASGLQHRAR